MGSFGGKCGAPHCNRWRRWRTLAKLLWAWLVLVTWLHSSEQQQHQYVHLFNGRTRLHRAYSAQLLPVPPYHKSNQNNVWPHELTSLYPPMIYCFHFCVSVCVCLWALSPIGLNGRHEVLFAEKCIRLVCEKLILFQHGQDIVGNVVLLAFRGCRQVQDWSEGFGEMYKNVKVISRKVDLPALPQHVVQRWRNGIGQQRDHSFVITVLQIHLADICTLWAPSSFICDWSQPRELGRASQRTIQFSVAVRMKWGRWRWGQTMFG